MIVHVIRSIAPTEAASPDVKSTIVADFQATMGELKCVGSERLVRLGISMAQLHMMHMLERHGELPMSRLAEMLDVSLSAATGLVDRMEERGFVERIRVPSDRRIVLVRITIAGRQMLDDVEILREGIIRRVLDELDDAQLAAVAAAMADLRIAVTTALADDPALHHAHLAPGEELSSPWKHSRRRRSTSRVSKKIRPSASATARRWRSSSRSCSGLFLGALDQTIVGPALPTIVTQLSGNDYYVWAITIYLLTSTISVPFWGKLSDIYGRKPIFMIGIVIFLIGSALSGLSQNMGMLILFRGIQGIGAGALFPVALAIIGDLFTPKERGKYQGLFGAVFGIAFVAGPLIGGWLTENLSWHWIFYVNIPIGIVALIVIQRLLPTVKTRIRDRATSTSSAARSSRSRWSFLLVGLTNKQSGDWTDRERRRVHPHRRSSGRCCSSWPNRAPRSRSSRSTCGATGPTRRRWSRSSSPPSRSSARSSSCRAGSRWSRASRRPTPAWRCCRSWSASSAARSSPGLLVSRTGHYKWLIVGSIAIMGFAVLLMTQLTKDTPVPVVWSGCSSPAWASARRSRSSRSSSRTRCRSSQLGVATSNLTFFRQIGGTIALAFVGTIFATSFQDNLIPQMTAAGVPQQVINGFTQASSSGSFDFNSLTGVGDLGAAILKAIPPEFQAAVQPFIGAMVEGVHGAFSLATAQAFWLGVFGSVVAFAASLAIKEIPLRTSNEQPVPTQTIAQTARSRQPVGRSAKPEPVSASTAVGD